MIKCIAIDDEPLALRQIVNYIEKTPSLELVNSFSSAIKAISYLQNSEVDLMFIDINMPDLSGIDFVKTLSNPPKFIFTTAYHEYAVEGFKVDAADYLVKPISYPDFLQSAMKIEERYFSEDISTKTVEIEDQFLFVKSEYRVVKISIDDIKYIESMRDYVRIHLDSQKPIMTLLSLSKLYGALPESKFIRVHRSYIVNRDKITTIERNRIIFDSNVYIPISDQYKTKFQQFLDQYMVK